MALNEGEAKNNPAGIRIYFFALILGSSASVAIAAYWLEVSPGWVALPLGALFSTVGAFLGENVGDATVFSLFTGLLVTLFFVFGPEISFLRTVIIPVATGLCMGKLVAGIATELST